MLILKQKHGMLSTTEFNLNACFTLNDGEILTMRKAICQQHVNKKVVVASSTSKIYFSNTKKMDGSNANFTPEWVYYATGVIALIYDSSELILALFEKSTIKLLWSLCWKTHTCFSSPASNFHVINLDSHFTQHVGMLHENESTTNLITKSIKTFCAEENVKSIDQSEWKNEINTFLNQKNVVKDVSQKPINENCINKLFKENSTNELLNFSQENTSDQVVMKQCVRRVKSDSAFSNKREEDKRNVHATEIHVNPSKQNQTNDTTETQILPSKFTRANSFRNANQASTKEENVHVLSEEKKKAKNNGEKEDSLIKTLFKKKSVSRSHSLQDKIVSEKTPQSQGLFTPDDRKNEDKKSNRLIKLRSATDSSLLCGNSRFNSMKNDLENGSVAKQEEENKYWTPKSEDKTVLSTDLCVTEL